MQSFSIHPRANLSRKSLRANFCLVRNPRASLDSDAHLFFFAGRSCGGRQGLAFLEPCAPYTLGLIGNIVNTRPKLVKAINVRASFEADFNEPNQLWSSPILSIDLVETPTSPPDLFSIVVLRPREQARFFCYKTPRTRNARRTGARSRVL